MGHRRPAVLVALPCRRGLGRRRVGSGEDAGWKPAPQRGCFARSWDCVTASTANDPPGVSVVIPAYNYAHFLPDAIESVLSQTYPNLELIVVDDGSTDDTADVVRRYGERVRYIHKKNAGLSAARNTGIRNASHPFVAFLDADDVWLPSFLQSGIDRFAQLPETYALVACKRAMIDEHGGALVKEAIDRSLSGEIVAADVVLKTRFPPSSCIVRRGAFDGCGMFDTELRSSEDRDMWIRIASRYCIWLSDGVHVKIRDHRGSMSKRADRMIDNVGKVLRRSFRDSVVPRWRVPYWFSVWSFSRYQYAWMCYEEGRWVKAVLELLRSLFLWPWFARPQPLDEPVLFRIRSLARFVRRGWSTGE